MVLVALRGFCFGEEVHIGMVVPIEVPLVYFFFLWIFFFD
jgi:hypothetical protein